MRNRLFLICIQAWGRVAFEFASRGAIKVVAVDSSHKSAQYIKEISKKLNTEVFVQKREVIPFLKNNSEKFDLTFADPPYSAAQEIANLIDFFTHNAEQRPQ